MVSQIRFKHLQNLNFNSIRPTMPYMYVFYMCKLKMSPLNALLRQSWPAGPSYALSFGTWNVLSAPSVSPLIYTFCTATKTHLFPLRAIGFFNRFACEKSIAYMLPSQAKWPIHFHDIDFTWENSFNYTASWPPISIYPTTFLSQPEWLGAIHQRRPGQ